MPSLQPHEQLVVDEHNELRARSEKLRAFGATPTFEALPEEDRELLNMQARTMSLYAWILEKRIQRFSS